MTTQTPTNSTTFDPQTAQKLDALRDTWFRMSNVQSLVFATSEIVRDARHTHEITDMLTSEQYARLENAETLINQAFSKIAQITEECCERYDNAVQANDGVVWVNANIEKLNGGGVS